MSSKVPQASHMAWIDLETADLPTTVGQTYDFSGVHIMEIGLIVTDNALNIWDKNGFVAGYQACVKMNNDMANALRANEITRAMHSENGLIRDCVASTQTLAEIDTEIDEMLSEVGIPRGMFAIAGSGVAAFDHPAIKVLMPKLASWLAYYPYDWGVFRRCIASAAGRYVVNPQLESYGETKLHRAMGDVTAHLREAQAYRDWVRANTPG